MYKGFTAGARCRVDGETRFGGQHYPKDPVLEIVGVERRCVREHRDANVDGQGRSDGRALRMQGLCLQYKKPREQVEPLEDLEQGSNVGDIGAPYVKDNLENTDIEDIPAMPTFH
ncbi:hypothetical protein U1Q18_026449 [Sarracenia purpurea var. burkii]